MTAKPLRKTKKRSENVACHISSESPRDAKSEQNNQKLHGSTHNKKWVKGCEHNESSVKPILPSVDGSVSMIFILLLKLPFIE